MIIYTAFIMGASVLNMVRNVITNKVLNLETLFMIPIFGRIFGWW